MTKKSPDILDFFKRQTDKNIYCPACGLSMLKAKLNEHLDSACSSSTNSSAKEEEITFLKSIKSKADDDFKIKTPSKSRNKLSLSRKNKLSLGPKQSVINSPINIQLKKYENNEDENQILSSKTSDTKKYICNELRSESNTIASTSTATENPPKRQKVSLMSLKGKKMVVAETEKKSKIIDKEPIFPRKLVSEHFHNINSNEKEITSEFDSDDVFIEVLKPDLKTQTQFNREPKSHANNNTKTNHKKQVNKKLSEIDSSNTEFRSKSSSSCLISHTKSIKTEYLSDDISAIFNDAKQCEEQDNAEFSENVQNEIEEDTNKHKPYSPYYLANFKYILKTVLAEENNLNLLNKEDMDYISAFQTLPNGSQKLYVRLFQRKYKWLRPYKLNYPEIAQDLNPVLVELVNAKLLDSGEDHVELETALNLLSLPEAKTLIKSFNFNSSGKNKAEISQLLLKHCKEHKSVFFSNGRNSVAIAMLKKVKQIMGPCYRISLLPKRLFTRILMLFSLPTISEDDEEAAGGQQQQLLTLLQVNKGELTFPDYERKLETVIFEDRNGLIRYEEARQLESDIFNAIESKAFELGKELYLNAKQQLDEQMKCNYSNRAASLPVFLRRYTSFHVYTRCLSQGVEILQKLRQYDEAVMLLRELLDQKVFCQDYRGKWYDRMALNLEQHLKQPKDALNAIQEALSDKNVQVGPRHALLTRAQRIVRNSEASEQIKQEILKVSDVLEAPKVTIKGRLVPRTILGRKHVFASNSGDNDDVTVLGVEQLAIEHYREVEDFPDGIHGEGSTFISLYTLLFWDIIYDGSIPDVFISPYQYHPLDLNSEAFFLSREAQILSHLDTIRNSTIEEVKEIVKSTWNNHHGQASLINWDLFVDVDHVQGLVYCFGNTILCGICERLSKDFRFTRSGVPDLVVWNKEVGRVKVVEVKGPGDKLSSKQILWLDYLMKLGAETEVCLVEAVQSKKLRKE